MSDVAGREGEGGGGGRCLEPVAAAITPPTFSHGVRRATCGARRYALLKAPEKKVPRPAISAMTIAMTTHSRQQ